MNRIFRNYCLSLLIILLGLGTAGCHQDPPGNSDLHEGFQDPPNEAKPYVYYALLNGYLNREFVDEELEAYAEKGVGGLLVFDMGIIGKEQFFPPAGPEFMSDEWLDNFSYIVKKADELGMEVELAACSSWDMGGAWVEPEEAVLALFQNSLNVHGPGTIKTRLEYPELPETALLGEDGKPVISEEVALLAIPVKRRQEAYEFVYKLGYDKLHRIHSVVLTNCRNTNKDIAGGEDIFAKGFAVEVSETDDKNESFKPVLEGVLEPNDQQQRFLLPEETLGRYVRLKLLNGYNERSDHIQLAEFQIFNEENEDLIHRPYNKRFDGGMEVRYNSQLGSETKWRALNLNDGKFSGDEGSWISNGKPPVYIEDVDDILLISDKLSSDGILEWDVPEGEWEIIRYVMSNTGEKLKIPNPASDGLATDHLSAAATRNHINYMADKLESKFGDLNMSPLSNFYLPSYEVRGLLWTYDLQEQFMSYRNYDLIKYLPALNGYLIEDEETTSRFLYDFQKTMGDLLIDAFYITANSTAKERGMAIKAESAGPGPPIHLVPVEALKALNSIDAMQGEFWPFREHWDGLWVVKEVASASHIYGGKTVHMEAFTGFRHWMDGPVDLKPSADRAFCEGMNHIVWHMAEHTPPEAGKPGWVYHAGSHFNVNLVWWNQMKPWMDYLARSSYMLQQGLFVGDVVYYYGDQGANFIPPKHTNKTLGFGFDYDVTNLEVMVSRMSVKEGRIVLPDGMSYEVLVLPDRDDITLSALERVKQLVSEGATVIGPRPDKSTGLFNHMENDLAVQKVAAELWGDIDGEMVNENKIGKGKVVFGKTINEVLEERGVTADFRFEGEASLDFIHRRTADEEIYFVRNRENEAASFKATFRVKGKYPELWFPETGERQSVFAYEENEDGISMDMNLDKYGSLFVVFTGAKTNNVKAVKGDAAVLAVSDRSVTVEAFSNERISVLTAGDRTIETSITNVPAADEVSGEWKIEFLNRGWGAPESVNTTELKPLSEFDDKGINYYSGISSYTKTVTVDVEKLAEGNRVWLDLGDLWLCADVAVNGAFVGNVWKAPYVIEVTEQVKAGENMIQIDLANTWSNRLIGDARHPDGKQYCRTNIDGNETTEAASWTDTELRKSGLFGPVHLIYSVQSEILR
ncbi:MAG: glycosyl hydrolase [Bacteroidota bacterium]